MALPELDRVKALSRCIIVENIQQFRSCVSSFTSPLIIVAPADCRDAAGQAVGKGHHVFLSADAISIDTRDNLMHLSRPNRDAVEEGLIQNGLSRSKAQAAARDFGWSMPVLRRHFSLPSAKRPLWTEAKSASILIPLLFAGAWDENKKGDRDVIESLSAISYNDYVNLLRPLLTIDDSPILKVGPIWKLKSPLDAWFMIATHLTEKHLQLFERAVISILTETDPKYDLKPEDRWLATIYGKDNPCSEWVRTGLVESLILIAVHGDRSENIASTQEFTNRVVKAVFSTAIKWESWASVKDVTPLLAEAAPETFMGAIEDIISNNPVLFQELLLDDGGLFGECRHAGLLWGIEGIAWKPEYFTRVSQILLELSKIDNGGRWANRPINTLKDLFILGLPQTYASPELRLNTLDILIKTNPVIVWQFAHSYYGGGTLSEAYRFKWRDPGGERRGLEYESATDYSVYE